MIGQYAAYQGKPREVPEHMDDENRRSWLAGYDSVIWNRGAQDGLRDLPALREDASYLDGYQHGQEQRKVRVVMPFRPEGYYHVPISNFA